MALILSVTISLSQPVFTGCFRGEGLRLAGSRVFCRGNRTEESPLELDWGLEKRGARLVNGKPHAGLSHGDWLVDGSTDKEVPEIEGEGDAVAEAGLAWAEQGLSADRLRKPGQPLDPFERGSLMASIERHLELGIRKDHANNPRKASRVWAKTVRLPGDLGEGKSPEILGSASARGGFGVEEGESGVGKGAGEKGKGGEQDSTARDKDGRGEEKLHEGGGGFNERGKQDIWEEEGEIEDRDEIENGEGKVEEERKTEEATEAVRNRQDESSAERYEYSTEEKEGKKKAEEGGGQQNMEEFVALENSSGTDLLSKAAAGESGETGGDGGGRPQESRGLRLRRAENDR